MQGFSTSASITLRPAPCARCLFTIPFTAHHLMIMIIDFHTHIFPSYFRKKRQSFFNEEPTFQELYRSPESNLVGKDKILKDMDMGQVQSSVVFGFPWENEEYFKRHNDYIIESVQKHRDRLIGFGCFSTRSPQCSKEAERCLEAGLSGVGELAFYQSHFTDEDIGGLKEIMALCAQYDAVIMLHTNEPVGHHYPGKTVMPLSRLYHFIKEHPANKIVLAHWGGGLFFYGLMKKEVNEVFKNVWFDTAASPYLYKPDVYRIAGEIVGVERILLGSDYPLLRPKRYLEEMASANLTDQAIQKISGENAAALLGLP